MKTPNCVAKLRIFSCSTLISSCRNPNLFLLKSLILGFHMVSHGFTTIFIPVFLRRDDPIGGEASDRSDPSAQEDQGRQVDVVPARCEVENWKGLRGAPSDDVDDVVDDDEYDDDDDDDDYDDDDVIIKMMG